MVRLLVIVEGDSEEAFVSQMLRPHLSRLGIDAHSRLNGDARSRAKRKGVKSWFSVSRDIIRLLKEDRKRYLTTFVDYYALPSGSDQNAWPGRDKASRQQHTEGKAKVIENALLNDIEHRYPSARSRFLPYISMHEFEALLFSDPKAFARGIGKPMLAAPMAEIRKQFSTPEEINDSPESAPSKRLASIFENLSCGKYQKPLFGVIGAKSITLDKMRKECPHFNCWLKRLECLAETL